MPRQQEVRGRMPSWLDCACSIPSFEFKNKGGRKSTRDKAVVSLPILGDVAQITFEFFTLNGPLLRMRAQLRSIAQIIALSLRFCAEHA